MADSPTFDSICVVGREGSGVPTAALLSGKFGRVHYVDLCAPWICRTHLLGAFAEPSMRSLVMAALDRQGLAISARPEPADVFILCVPDGSWAGYGPAATGAEVLRPWVQSVADCLAPGNMLVLQSLAPPGTTDGSLQDLLGELVAGYRTSWLCLACTAEPVGDGFRLYELVSGPRVLGMREPDLDRVLSIYATFVEGDLISAEPRVAEMANIAHRLMASLRGAMAYEVADAGIRHGIAPAQLLRVVRQLDVATSGRALRMDQVLRRPLDPLLVECASPVQMQLGVSAQQVHRTLLQRIVSSVRSLVSELGDAKVVILAPDSSPATGGPEPDYAMALAQEVTAVAPGSSASVLRLPSGAIDREHLLLSLQGTDLLVILCGPRELSSLEPAQLASVVQRRIVLDPLRVLQTGRWADGDFALQP